MFQLGLGAYLAVVLKLQAGGRRWGQRIVVAESVLLLLAAVWSACAVAGFSPTVHRQGFVMTALDAAWPLSMLGLVAVAIAIARARVFPGATRWVPLLASLWLVADLAAFVISPAIHLTWLVGPYGLLAMVLLRWLPRQLGSTATPAAEAAKPSGPSQPVAGSRGAALAGARQALWPGHAEGATPADVGGGMAPAGVGTLAQPSPPGAPPDPAAVTGPPWPRLIAAGGGYIPPRLLRWPLVVGIALLAAWIAAAMTLHAAPTSPPSCWIPADC
jgi:hypothetical protein